MSTSDFTLVKPITVTDAMLVSSSVPETVVAEYAAGTTYAAGAIRGVTTGTAQIVYESLQAGNLGHTPASSPLWWKVLGTVYAAYSGAVSYADQDIVSSISTDSHLLYRSLVAGNLGNPLTDKTKWQPLGSTNRHKMFDKAVNSKTVAPEKIVFTVNPGQLVNFIALLAVEGATVTVEQSISGYSSTKSLVSHPVNNWYDFYYEVPLRKGDVVFDDIPPYPGSTLTITIENPGGDAAIGLFGMGKSRVIGTTLWELSGGILSYSGSNTDAFGNTMLIKRSNAKRLNVEVKIFEGFEDEAHRLLTLYTDVELIVVATSAYSMAILYCYLGQWEIPISIAGKPAPIELKGLI